MVTGSPTGGRTIGVTGYPCDSLKLGEDRLESVRAVLGVDEQPVHPAAGADLRDQGAAAADPHADERTVRCGQLAPRKVRPRLIRIDT